MELSEELKKLLVEVAPIEDNATKAVVLANLLIARHYTQVVWCLKCKHYDDCPKWLGGCMEENLFYCSSGEPKEVS